VEEMGEAQKRNHQRRKKRKRRRRKKARKRRKRRRVQRKKRKRESKSLIKKIHIPLHLCLDQITLDTITIRKTKQASKR
jgi:hypothetical protein